MGSILSHSSVRAAAVVVLLAACSGTYVAANGDAGTDTRDAATTEGPDASVDGAPSADANARDARPDAEDASSPPSPCAAVHTFCDDFDDAGADPARWDGIDTRAGAVTLDDTLAITKPRSLRVTLEARQGITGSSLTKNVDLRPGTTSALLEFDYRADFPAPPWSFTEIDPLVLRIQPAPAGAKYQQFGFVVYPTGARFEYFGELLDGGSVFDDRNVALAYTGWHHVAVALALGGGNVEGKLYLDGIETSTLAYATSAMGRLEILIGTPFVRESNVPVTFRYDNVVVDSK